MNLFKLFTTLNIFNTCMTWRENCEPTPAHTSFHSRKHDWVKSETCIDIGSALRHKHAYEQPYSNNALSLSPPMLEGKTALRNKELSTATSPEMKKVAESIVLSAKPTSRMTNNIPTTYSVPLLSVSKTKLSNPQFIDALKKKNIDMRKKTIEDCAKFLESYSEWNSPYGDLLPYLLVKTSWWPKEVALEVNGIRFSNNTDEVATTLKLDLTNDHYTYKEDGIKFDVDGDGNCFHAAVLKGFESMGSFLPENSFIHYLNSPEFIQDNAELTQKNKILTFRSEFAEEFKRSEEMQAMAIELIRIKG